MPPTSSVHPCITRTRAAPGSALAVAQLLFVCVALLTGGPSRAAADPRPATPAARAAVLAPARIAVAVKASSLAAAYSIQALGQDVTLDAGSSTATGAAITSRQWDFGDGSSASGLHVSHSYAKPGDYSVVLTVTDAEGQTATKTQTVSVPSFRTGLEDGVMNLTCSTSEPNNMQPVFMPGTSLASAGAGGNMALRAFWTETGYNGKRNWRGTEICTISTLKEAWIGFMFRLPAVGYPMDKTAGMFQIFQSGTCNSWGALMSIVNNSLSLTHRHYCGGGTVTSLLADIPRDTWIPVIVHMVASHQAAGKFEVWVNGAPKNAPTYSAININFGFGSWLADDSLAPENSLGVKFGQYDYDDAHYTPGETRTSYYDSIHLITSSRADGWEAVNPVGADFGTSVALTASDAQMRTTHRAAAAFDAAAGASWQSVNKPAAWLLYGYPAAGQEVVGSYGITNGSDAALDPKDWTFEASDDGVTWTALDYRTGEVFSARGAQRTFTIANAKAYHYYRLNISANQGGAGIEISKLALKAR